MYNYEMNINGWMEHIGLVVILCYSSRIYHIQNSFSNLANSSRDLVRLNKLTKNCSALLY